MTRKQKIVLKVTGELISCEQDLIDVVSQLKALVAIYNVGLIIGGGNIFRGNRQTAKFNITAPRSHYIGMYATVINSLILEDLCEQAGLRTKIISSLDQSSSSLNNIILNHEIFNFNNNNYDLVIFAGGTSMPYVSTDTSAIIRALEIQADEIWKGTKVDGVYTADPLKDKNAKKLDKLTYDYMQEHNIQDIIDPVAVALAKEYNLKIRIFDIFSPNILLKMAEDKSLGSLIER